MYLWPGIFQSVHIPSGEKSSAKIVITNNINLYYYSSVGKEGIKFSVTAPEAKHLATGITEMLK